MKKNERGGPTNKDVLHIRFVKILLNIHLQVCKLNGSTKTEIYNLIQCIRKGLPILFPL